MSGVAKNTLADHPGHLENDQECDHRGQLPQDPPTEFTQHCEQTAVFAVPHPNGLGQCLGLCPWHLARYLDAYDDRQRRLSAKYDLDQHLEDEPWLGLDDLPQHTHVPDDDDRWQLLALDQRGHAYYVDDRNDPSGVAVYANGHWQHYDEFFVPPEGSAVRDICDHIADVHGLAALPSDVVDAITGGDPDA
jgi:hypothetical protein